MLAIQESGPIRDKKDMYTQLYQRGLKELNDHIKTIEWTDYTILISILIFKKKKTALDEINKWKIYTIAVTYLPERKLLIEYLSRNYF